MREYEITTNINLLIINDNKINVNSDIKRILRTEKHKTTLKYWTEKGNTFKKNSDKRNFKIITNNSKEVVRYQEYDPKLGGSVFYQLKE